MNVGTSTRQQIAAAAVVSLAVLTAASFGRGQGQPPIRQFIGYGFVFFVLSAGADFGLALSGPFAILAMVAIILEQGPDALKFLGQRGSISSTKPPPPIAASSTPKPPVRR